MKYFSNKSRESGTEGSSFLGPEDEWLLQFSEDTLKSEYIEVEEGIKILVTTSTPKGEITSDPFILVGGWFSVITSWTNILKELAKTTVVYYVDSREKTSAIHLKRKVDFTIIETDQDSLHEYGNALVEIVLSNPTGEVLDGGSDVDILYLALQKDDPKILDSLIPIQEAYSEVTYGLFAMNVPSILAHCSSLISEEVSKSSAVISAYPSSCNITSRYVSPSAGKEN